MPVLLELLVRTAFGFCSGFLPRPGLETLCGSGAPLHSIEYLSQALLSRIGEARRESNVLEVCLLSLCPLESLPFKRLST